MGVHYQFPPGDDGGADQGRIAARGVDGKGHGEIAEDWRRVVPAIPCGTGYQLRSAGTLVCLPASLESLHSPVAPVCNRWCLAGFPTRPSGPSSCHRD